MSRPKYYSPVIQRFLVSVLFHEAKRRGIPMTRLANEILEQGLKPSPGWRLAETASLETVNQPTKSDTAISV